MSTHDLAAESPIRVCYLAHYTAGGSAISLNTLLQHLDRKQCAPMVIFHRVKNPALVTSIEEQGIRVVGLVPPRSSPARSLPKMNVSARLGKSGLRGWVRGAYRTSRAVKQALVRDVRWIPALARQLREFRPHLVHCNNGLRAHRLDLLLCAALGIPTVCHVRSFEPLTLLERLAARKVRRFIYISGAVATHYHQQGISSLQNTVIPNAVADKVFEKTDPLPRAEFGWGPEHFVVANVGRLVTWKGQDVFLQAIARLAPQLPSLRALVVGAVDDNPASRAFADRLHQMVQDLRIADRVVFTGYRSDALRIMATSDVVVHSATTPEPFGRVVIEAMATGRPVIATAAGGVLDIVTDQVTGMLVPPGDAVALGKRLWQLADDSALAAQLGRAGQCHAVDHFSAAQHVASVMALYQLCLPKGSTAKVPSGDSSRLATHQPLSSSSNTSMRGGDNS